MAQRRKAKSKESRSGRGSALPPMSGTLARQLDHIESLVDAKKLEQAQRELIPLCQRYPNRPEPLSWLVRVSQRLNDHDELQHACERLLRLTPGERDVTLLWAGSSLASARPATARRAILRFLAQWPDDPVAEKMHEQLRDIEAHFRSFLGCYALPDDAMWELADQHEQVLMLLSRRQPERSREAAQKLLARHPSFVPGWNNLGLALFYLGDLAGSIGACQRVLEIEPENFQALSNLIRGLALANQRDDALALAPRLKAAQSNSADLHVKKAEALAMLSDDEGVLEQLKEAEAHRPLDLEEDARLFHYAAVAALHQGDEPRARELWRRALQLDPRLSIARGNLDDLAEAPERREGPWAFDMVNLIPEAWLARLALHRDKSRASRDQVRRVLERNPQIVAAAPAALEVGDPITRDFFITLAAHTGLPELVEALKGFALGQRGPFASRAKTVQMLGEKGFLPPGPVRVWHQGEWDEISVLTFEISGEATTVHTPGVMRLVDEARAAMNKGEFPRSEQLWRQALQLEPDKPDLLNNLATAVRQQDRVDEANALLDDLLRRHPDYLFGRVNSAHRYIEEGKFAEAHEVLKPLFRRRKLHTTEFFGLAGAWISLLISEGTPAAAQPWLSMWKQIAPDHPQLRFWQQQLSICRRRQLQH